MSSCYTCTNCARMQMAPRMSLWRKCRSGKTGAVYHREVAGYGFIRLMPCNAMSMRDNHSYNTSTITASTSTIGCEVRTRGSRGLCDGGWHMEVGRLEAGSRHAAFDMFWC